MIFIDQVNFFLCLQDINIASSLVEKGYARFSNLINSDESNQAPMAANGTPHPTEETLTVPPDSGESEGENEGEFAKETPVTG